MNVLFNVFKYTDEYFEKIQKGIVSEEDDCELELNCYREKYLINLSKIKAARPTDNGKYTEVCAAGDTFYIIDVPFNDFIKVCPHITYPVLKSKWAN